MTATRAPRTAATPRTGCASTTRSRTGPPAPTTTRATARSPARPASARPASSPAATTARRARSTPATPPAAALTSRPRPAPPAPTMATPAPTTSASAASACTPSSARGRRASRLFRTWCRWTGRATACWPPRSPRCTARSRPERSASSFSGLGAGAEKVVVRNKAGWGSPILLIADRVSVKVAFWPLLSRRVVVRKVVLDGVAATVERNPEGALNIDDFLSAGGRPSEGAQAATAAAFLVSNVVLTRSRVQFVDRKVVPARP